MLLLLVTLGMTGLYVSLCFNNNVWTDEAYTMRLIQKDFAGIIQGTAGDVHPPLYYFLAKLAALLFPTREYRLLVQKLVTILPTVLTLYLGGVWLYKKTGKVLSGLLYMGSLGFLVCSMEYAVQVRMYSWALLFVTLCGLEAYEAYVSGRIRHYVLFALWGVAAAYTHYFAFVSAVIICGLFFLVLAVRKRMDLLRWLLTVGCMLLAYLPWLFVLLQQFHKVTVSYWIPEIDGAVIQSYFTWAFGTEIAFSTAMILTLYVLGGLIGLYCLIRKRTALGIFSVLCWLVPALTAAAGVTVSFLFSPIYYDRYVFPAMGLLCIFFGLSWSHAEEWYQFVLFLFCLCFGVQRYRDALTQEYFSTHTAETEQYLAEHLTQDDIVVYNWNIYAIVYQYYVDSAQLVYIENVDWENLTGDIYFFDTASEQKIRGEILEAYGLEMEYAGQMGIEQNDFGMYHIYRKE